MFGQWIFVQLMGRKAGIIDFFTRIGRKVLGVSDILLNFATKELE